MEKQNKMDMLMQEKRTRKKGSDEKDEVKTEGRDDEIEHDYEATHISERSQLRC